MGQYYKPVNTQNLRWLYPKDYDNFIKLMEHSWLKNDLVETVENLISEKGKWQGSPIVWAGDYYSEKNEIDYYHLATDDKKICKRSIKYS